MYMCLCTNMGGCTRVTLNAHTHTHMRGVVDVQSTAMNTYEHPYRCKHIDLHRHQHPHPHVHVHPHVHRVVFFFVVVTAFAPFQCSFIAPFIFGSDFK